MSSCVLSGPAHSSSQNPFIRILGWWSYMHVPPIHLGLCKQWPSSGSDSVSLARRGRSRELLGSMNATILKTPPGVTCCHWPVNGPRAEPAHSIVCRSRIRPSPCLVQGIKQHWRNCLPRFGTTLIGDGQDQGTHGAPALVWLLLWRARSWHAPGHLLWCLWSQVTGCGRVRGAPSPTFGKLVTACL